MQYEVLASLFAKENKENELKKREGERERDLPIPAVQWARKE